MAIKLPIVSSFDPSGMKQAQGALKGFTKSLGGVALAIGAAFSVRAISNFAKESVAIAEAAATAQARLEAVAKATGVFGDQASAVTNRLSEFAKAQEMRIAVDDKVIKGVQAQLLTFKDLSASAGEVGGAFDRATIAAFDMAQVQGSAEGNALALAKALENPIKGISALTRNGTTFTEQQKEQIKVLQESGDLLGAQELILAEVESQYGGLAAASADASDKLAIAAENIKESFGDALLPVFADLVEGLIPVFETIGEVLGDTVTEMQPMLTDLVGQIPGLLQAFIPLIPAIASIAEMFIGLISAALPFITDILNVLIPVIGELMPVIMKAIDSAFEPLMDAFMVLVDALIPLVEEFLPVFAQIIGELAPMFADLVAEIAPMVGELLPPLLDLFFQLIDALRPMIEKLLPIIIDLFSKFAPIVVTLISAFMPLIQAILPPLVSLLEILIPILEFMARVFSIILVTAINIFIGVVEGVQKFIQNFGPVMENVFISFGIVFATIINGMISGFENFINFFVEGFNLIIKGVNRVRRSLGQSEFGMVAKVSFGRVEVPTLKPMAVGGIVTGPTAALIGEAGPEAVIPLDKMGGMGNTYNITINANVADARLGEVVVNAIKRYERTSGPVFASA
jgi:phage-related protein